MVRGLRDCCDDDAILAPPPDEEEEEALIKPRKARPVVRTSRASAPADWPEEEDGSPVEEEDADGVSILVPNSLHPKLQME